MFVTPLAKKLRVLRLRTPNNLKVPNTYLPRLQQIDCSTKSNVTHVSPISPTGSFPAFPLFYHKGMWQLIACSTNINSFPSNLPQSWPRLPHVNFKCASALIWSALQHCTVSECRTGTRPNKSEKIWILQVGCRRNSNLSIAELKHDSFSSKNYLCNL